MCHHNVCHVHVQMVRGGSSISALMRTLKEAEIYKVNWQYRGNQAKMRWGRLQHLPFSSTLSNREQSQACAQCSLV